MAYYPFLAGERARLKTLDLRLEKLAQHPIYGSALEGAACDVEGKGKPPADADFAAVEFTLAKILLGIIGEPDASEAYAERKGNEFRESLDKENLTLLIKIAREEFGMEVKTEESLRLQFIDFLRYKPEFLKLAQADLQDGYVQLSKTQLAWVLKGAIKRQILDTIPKGKGFPEAFSKAANAVRGKIAKPKAHRERPTVSSLTEDALPPCIKGILAGLEGGVANHNAHFVLATFLTGLGLEEPAVVDVFRRSRKFNERTTAYQVKFAKEKGYTCPACDSIKGYGLCKAECERKHPASNYFLNLRRLKGGGGGGGTTIIIRKGSKAESEAKKGGAIAANEKAAVVESGERDD